MKKFIIAFLGFLYGIFSTFWGLLGAAFTFPDSSPGSKDYEEDCFFIPLGIIMLLSYIAVTIFSYYKLRKKKSYIIIFSVSLVIGISIYIFFIVPI